MPYDKVPREYNPEAMQKIIDNIQREQRRAEGRRAADTIDVALRLKRDIQKVEDQLVESLSAGGEDAASQPFNLPTPRNLKCYELINWGWTTVVPYLSWKYWGKIRGYEFYGSQNQDFTPQAEPYTETGTHRGSGTLANPDTYLDTEDIDDPTNTFVLDPRLNNTGKIILENTTRSVRGKIDGLETDKLKDSTQSFPLITSGMKVQNTSLNKWATVLSVAAGELTLDDDIFTRLGEGYLVGAGLIPLSLFAFGLKKRYQVKATGVTWVAGDEWRIYDYPENRLLSIGSLATFLKRKGNFYVRARTIGRGKSFSDFYPPLTSSPITSSGLSSSEDLSTPSFVQPVYSDGKTCPIDTNPSSSHYGKPIHPDTGLPVEWTSIVDGCRELDHVKFFGFEWCNVEIVYETISEDDDDTNIFYRVRRTGALVGTPTVDEEGEESELS